MIIVNGKLNILYKTGGGFQNGMPIPASEELGSDIPCNIGTPHAQHHDNVSADGNAYKTAEYTLLVDVPVFEAEDIMLFNSRLKCLGRCRVQSVQYLDCVEAVQIKVTRYAD